MTNSPPYKLPDTPGLRKARGAFFTPAAITRFIADWAVRSSTDKVLEPSAGEAAFLIAAVDRLQKLGKKTPTVAGVEIHSDSAETAERLVELAGGKTEMTTSDFFLLDPQGTYDAVIGNPPYIRFQEFNGESRLRARLATLKAGVPLSGLASSWAAFTIQSALFLRPGGRMGLVLPAELLSVNYAAPVRQFLFDRFKTVELVMFANQVFPDAEADVVLLLADGFDSGPTSKAVIHHAADAQSLDALRAPVTWSPNNPSDKWTELLVTSEALEPSEELRRKGAFAALSEWGATTLGMVTGNNSYFALSPARVRDLGLTRRDLVRLCPPGSSHLRALSLTSHDMTALGREGKSTWLFYPSANPTEAAKDYIEIGRRVGVDNAYKCRTRKTWYQVPLLAPADLFLTSMNADTPRLTTNEAGARHLNSVHGVYLKSEHRPLGKELLPLASLNSVTILSAELVGRAYGGGLLKLEPREADKLSVPSPALVELHADGLRGIQRAVLLQLRLGDLIGAVKLVDKVIFKETNLLSADELDAVTLARQTLAQRRTVRGKRVGASSNDAAEQELPKKTGGPLATN